MKVSCVEERELGVWQGAQNNCPLMAVLMMQMLCVEFHFGYYFRQNAPAIVGSFWF